MKSTADSSNPQADDPFSAMTARKNTAAPFTILFLVAIALAVLVACETNARSTAQDTNATSPPVLACGKVNVSKVFGKIQFVDSFPDYRVKVVDSFPDLKVKKVASFPTGPGKWQIVNSFPDFKIKIVDSFPDFTIKYVSSFPGVD